MKFCSTATNCLETSTQPKLQKSILVKNYLSPRFWLSDYFLLHFITDIHHHGRGCAILQGNQILNLINILLRKYSESGTNSSKTYTLIFEYIYIELIICSNTTYSLLVIKKTCWLNKTFLYISSSIKTHKILDYSHFLNRNSYQTEQQHTVKIQVSLFIILFVFVFQLLVGLACI